MQTLIKNGWIVSPADQLDGMADIFIEDGRIKAIGKNIDCPSKARVIDAAGLKVLPGLVDMHCHLREPGYEYKETIHTGTRAAARGGFTTVCCMANTYPVADNGAVIHFIKSKALQEGAVHVYPIGAVSKNLEGKEIAEIGEMKEAGAVAFSDDGKPVWNSQLMRLALQYAKPFGIPIIAHCEDSALVNEGVMNEGYYATILGLRGIPHTAEEVMVSRDILLAKAFHATVHIAHVSTKGSVELIRQAKKEGVTVTCETVPHYLVATDEWVKNYDASTKVNPPLRTQSDREALIKGLCDGTIDCIATDHAPHHADDKECPYQLAAFGISGFETAFSLCYTQLVKSGLMTLAQLTEKMSTRPAEILNIPSGRLQVGGIADITLVNTDACYTIDKNSFLSKGKNTPFHGYSVQGRVVHTMVAGKWVIQNGMLHEDER